MDSAGFLSGRSDLYHRTLTKLDQMFLVDVYGYQPLPKGDPKTEYHPASFAGWFEVFDGNGDVLRKRRMFHADNFHLTAAPAAPTRLQPSRSLRPNVNEYATDEPPIRGVPVG
jgi:hypothetical protein